MTLTSLAVVGLASLAGVAAGAKVTNMNSGGYLFANPNPGARDPP